MTEEEHGSWQAEVSAHEAGVRLDAFVAGHAACSRARARELLDQGLVEIDGRVAVEKDKGRRLQPGQVVRALAPALVLDRLVGDADSDLVLLAQGEGWIAVDKPAGVAVHPLRASDRGTMLQRVVARWPEIEGVGESGRRSGVVHRLDVDTSGVQLFALRQAAWERLRAAFRQHRIEKVYRALVRGRPEPSGEVALDLVVAAHRPARVRAFGASEGGASARRCTLRWRVLEQGVDTALVEVRPSTGFLHQVRVTLAHLGHPLLGDAVYGGGAEIAAAPRHLLHASALNFEEIAVTSPDPIDFAAVLARLRAG